MDTQQLQARIEALEANQARIDAGLSGAIQSTNGLHEPVQAVAVVSVPVLSGLLVIDGVITFDGSRVLLANQGDATGGIWLTHAGAWTRPTDWAPGQVIQVGEQIFVGEGGTNYPRFGSRWMVTQGGVVDTNTPIIYPAVDKGTGLLDLALVDAWIYSAATVAFANDTTVGAPASVNVTAITPGGANFGRGTGTLTLDGTGGHSVVYSIFNF